MEAAVVLVALFQGMVIGLVAIDMVQRFNDRKALVSSELSRREAEKSLAELHNSSTQNIKNLADKVGALEMSMQGKNPATPMKKFT